MPDPRKRQARTPDNLSGQALKPVVLRELSDLEGLVRRLLVEKKEPASPPRPAARVPQRPAPSENVVETILQRIRDISEMTRNLGQEPVAQSPLEDRRKKAAELALEAHDFGTVVEGYKVWTVSGDDWSIEVFISGSEPSDQHFFEISFPQGSATPWPGTHRTVLSRIAEEDPSRPVIPAGKPGCAGRGWSPRG